MRKTYCFSTIRFIVSILFIVFSLNAFGKVVEAIPRAKTGELASKTNKTPGKTVEELPRAKTGELPSKTNWSDTMLGYMYGQNYKYPGTIFSTTPSGKIFVRRNVPVNTVIFYHADGYKYGENFFNIEFLNPTKNNPEHGDYGQQQSREVFGVYRHTLSLSAITGKKLCFWYIKDFGIKGGFNFGANNNAVNEAQFTPVLGLRIMFDVNGYFNIAIMAYKEWNNNRFNRPAKQVFDTTWTFESAWGIEVPGGIFEGFLITTGPKGRDTAGVRTKTETLTEAYYMIDIGKIFFKTKNTFYAGFGGEYWRHKFGTYNGASSNKVPHLIISKNTRTPVFRFEYHF